MAENALQPNPVSPDPAGPSQGSGLAGWRGAVDQAGWAQLWQVPALLMGLGLFALGVWLVYPTSEVPDFEGVLRDADALVRAESAESLTQAQDKLELVRAGLELHPPADPKELQDVRGRYWQYSGDVAYLQQSQAQLVPVDTKTRRKNLQLVLDHYDKAQSAGRELDGRSMRYKAFSLVSLDREKDALVVVDQLDPRQPEQRYGIVRDLIERRLDEGASDPIALEPLLTRFDRELRNETRDPQRLEQQRWAVALRARGYLEVGDPKAAITYLSKEMQRLRSAGLRDASELMVLLAQAHQIDKEFEDAVRQFRLAQSALSPGDPLNAEVLLGLGQIELASGGDGYLDRAYAPLDQVVQQYPTSKPVADALKGLGYIEAMRDAYPAALDYFRRSVQRWIDQSPDADRRRQPLVDTVLTQVDRAIEQARYDEALDLLAVLRPFFGDKLPTEMLLQFAQIHEQIAEQRMQRAATMDPLTWQGPGDPPIQARKKAFQEAATHFAQSAENYLAHSRRVNIANAEQHGSSLWQAAVNFDKAQRWTQAIEVYDEFIQTRPVDGQQLQARHRLAGAYLAQGDAQVAIDLFNNLINEHPTSQWAYDSLVPLARAYTAVNKPEEAIKTLREVVQGHPAITPDSKTYHDALLDLARTYYLAGDQDPAGYARAIETLTEAIKRFGDGLEGPELRYMLADALRRSAYALNQKLADQLADRDRATILAERNQRLLDAQELFRQAREALEARHEMSLSQLERLYRQNAWFYEADSAYARGDYEVAIGRYQEAAERWSDTPSALAAMVQIVNAHCELGQFESARTWNNRALKMLDRIEDEAFKKPDMPMTAQHWRDWLRWSAELDLFSRQANAG